MRCWDDVQGIIEYELPMVLLHPVKDLKSYKSCQHAVDKVMPIIKAEMAHYRTIVHEVYTKQHFFHVKRKRPLKRPDESHLREFFPWIEDVVITALTTREQISSLRSVRRARVLTRDG